MPVDSFEPNDLYARTNPLLPTNGLPPTAAMLMSMLLGHNYVPTSATGSGLGNLLQRERAANFMSLYGGFNQSLAMQRLGVGKGWAGNLVGSILGAPNSSLGGMVAGLTGGNPVATSMRLYGGLTGANVMGAFAGDNGPRGLGRNTSLDIGEVPGLMDTIQRSISNIEKPEVKNARLIKQLQGMTPEARAAEGFKDVTGKEDFSPTGAEGKMIRDRIAQRKNRSTTLQSMLDKSLSKGMKDLDETTSKSISEFIEKQYSEAEKATLGIRTKDGKIDRTTAARLIKADRASSGFQDSVTAADRWLGINFEKTRGFSSEDLTSGLWKAADLRMLGGDNIRGKNTVQEATKGFFENAGGVLDAGRSVWGNASVGDLMGNINKLVGTSKVDLSSAKGAGETSKVDLSSAKGAGEIEELLRKTDATARVAGVGIKTMLGIIDSVEELAANNPRLQHVSSLTLHKATVENMLDAANTGAAMSAEDFRAAGGAQGIHAAKTKSMLSYAQSSQGGAQALLLQMADQMKDGGKSYKYIQDKIRAGELTGKDLASGELGKIAAMLGTNASQLGASLQNQYARDTAMKNDKYSSVIMDSETVTNNNYADTTRYLRNRGLSEKQLQAYFNRRVGEGASEDTISTELAAKYYRTPEQQAQWAAKKDATFEKLRMGRYTPEEKAALKAQRDAQVKSDTELSKQFAAARSPILTQAISALARGGTVEDVAGSMAAIVATHGDLKTEAWRAETSSAGESMLKKFSSIAGTDDRIGAGIVKDINTFKKNIGIGGSQELTDAQYKALEDSRDSFKSKYGTFERAEEGVRTIDKRIADAKQKHGADSQEYKDLLTEKDALQGALNSGVATNKEAWQKYLEGGTGSGMMEATRQKNIEVAGAKAKAVQGKILGDSHAADNLLRAYGGDTAALLADQAKMDSAKTDEEKEAASKTKLGQMVKLNGAKINSQVQAVRSANKRIADATAAADNATKETPEQKQQAELVDCMKKMISAITGGNEISKSIAGLTAVLGSKTP